MSATRAAFKSANYWKAMARVAEHFQAPKRSQSNAQSDPSPHICSFAKTAAKRSQKNCYLILKPMALKKEF
jgi:hypothetical protein